MNFGKSPREAAQHQLHVSPQAGSPPAPTHARADRRGDLPGDVAMGGGCLISGEPRSGDRIHQNV